MHVVTNTNLLALATELSGHGIHEEYDATAEEFHTLIENIFTKSSFLHKWDNLTSLGEPNDDNMDEDDNMDSDDEMDDDDTIMVLKPSTCQSRQEEDEMMNFHLGRFTLIVTAQPQPQHQNKLKVSIHKKSPNENDNISLKFGLITST